MKKTRLKKLGHLYATDEMLCMAEQDIPENKKIGWQRVEPVFQREVYLQSKICDGILMVAIYLARIYGWEVKNHYMKFSLIRVKESISLGIQ